MHSRFVSLFRKTLHSFTILALAVAVLAANRVPASTEKEPTLLTGTVEVTAEAKKILPKGAIIYYSKSTRKPGTQYDRWAIEALDVHSGRTEELITNETSGIVELIPYSISPDKKYLLFGGRQKNNRNAIFEIDVKTKKWRKIADDIISGRYSPNGKHIAAYFKPNYKTFKTDKILKVSILNRDGTLETILPCSLNQCFHPYWINNNDILYSQDALISQKKRQNNSGLFLYSLNTSLTKYLYTTKRLSLVIENPRQCMGKIVFIIRNKYKTYIPELRRAGHKKILAILKEKKISKFKMNSIGGFSCLNADPNYIIASYKSPIAIYKRTEQMHLVIINLKDLSKYRLFKKPSYNTTYIYPIQGFP